MNKLSTGLWAGAFACLVALGACAHEVPPNAALPHAIAIRYKAIPLSDNNPELTRVGRLIYRGGLELSSPEPRFGGWSGLVVSANGKQMLSQSDEAHWLRARLLYNAKGDLSGIVDAQLADMRDLHGDTMNKAHGDAEGLDALSAKGPDGPVAVSFEGDDRIWRYDLSKSLDVRPYPVPMPNIIRKLKSNQGLEGLTLLKPHTLLAVAEVPQMGPDHPAWIVPLGKGAGAVERLNVIRHPPYEISDAAMGPSGKHLFLLERHYFGLIGGVVIAVREIDAAKVKPGAVLKGHEIARFNMRENIDNMEGLALRRGADGKTYLYMISDDNYNHVLQRTLLLMFELAPAQ